MKAIIPDPYLNFTINDFTGKHDGKNVLSLDIAVRAKEQLVKYCWGDGMTLEKFNSLNDDQRKDVSKIDLRRREGRNVVIYSDAASFSEETSNKGKTFIAALIMKEAIGRRSRPGGSALKYDWLEFSMLQYLRKNSDSELNPMRVCDWLVVDDISNLSAQSAAADAYISQLVNPFFFERLQDGLPTIFVFRFDVSKATFLEERFGLAISKIVRDPRSFKISLCGGE